MPRFQRLAGAVALALGCAGAAQAQQFSGFFVFGDSLSDSGNIALASALPPGNSFTTNFDPVAAEIIAAAFGLPGGPSLAGGPNFAWGGACINAAGPCLNPVPNIPTQVQQYLALTGGTADPNALYSMWGGANDIFATLVLAPGSAQANTTAAALAYVTQIGTLQAAGANYIIVYNLPNLGATPQFAGTVNAGAVSQLTVVFNSTLNAGLAGLNDGIIPINTFGLIDEIFQNPGLYGFTNLTGQACGVGSSSVACGPAGSGLPYTYAPGTNDTWLFADGVHPTGAAHRILANVVLSTIAAPSQMSMIGEAGLQSFEDHRRGINDVLMSDFQLDREVGSVRAYATVQYGDQDFDGTGDISAADGNQMNLTLGATHRITENIYWGLAATLGNGDTDVGPTNLESRPVTASIYGAYRSSGGAYVHASIGGGSTSVDVERRIVMGPTIRTETSSTNASGFGGEIGGGWLFGDAGGVQHGPFVSVALFNQKIDAFAEESGSATSMNFSDFDRDSLVSKVGYQLQGNMGGDGMAFRPFLRVAYNQEHEDDQVFVNAGSNSMNGRFTLAGFQPSEDWVTADIGTSFALGDDFTGFVAYNGRFSDDQQERHAVSLGIRMDF